VPRLEKYRTVVRFEGEWTTASEANDSLRRLQRALLAHGFRLMAARSARVVDEEIMFELTEPLELDPDV
jgi:hypothetical protein